MGNEPKETQAIRPAVSVRPSVGPRILEPLELWVLVNRQTPFQWDKRLLP